MFSLYLFILYNLKFSLHFVNNFFLLLFCMVFFLVDLPDQVIEALEIAFQEIDNEKQTKKVSPKVKPILKKTEPKIVTDFEELQEEIGPIYETIDDILDESNAVVDSPRISPKKKANHVQQLPKKTKTKATEHKNISPQKKTESYYQVPNPEPYYEVPKTKPVPLYENVDMFGTAINGESPIDGSKRIMEPPKEKPPPPPIEEMQDRESESQIMTEEDKQDMFKRINSTKRIKKEIWNKRSSFLGIEGPDDSVFEVSVAPPPDMATFLEEERRLQRQLIMKAGFSDSSDTGKEKI